LGKKISQLKETLKKNVGESKGVMEEIARQEDRNGELLGRETVCILFASCLPIVCILLNIKGTECKQDTNTGELEQQQRVFGGREDRRATLLEAINDEYFQKQVNSETMLTP
jgi:hypothetical protein